MISYKEYTNDIGDNFLARDNGDGSISHIPCDEGNSDYQAYLNPVEHLTEIPTEGDNQ